MSFVDTAEKKNVISFKFKNQEKQQQLTTVKLDDSPKSEESNKNHIISFDKNDSKRSTKRVIPLPKSIPINKENVDSLTKAAMEELVRDAENMEVDNKEGKFIKIINQERVKHVEMDERDYEDMPMEEFGKAMMRGMGWKDGDVGVPIHEVKRGFTSHKKNNKMDEEEFKLGNGSYCIFTSGFKKGQYGRVVDDDGLRMMVKLASTDENVNTCEACLRAVSKEEYQKSKKYINSSKVQEYLEEQNKKYIEKEGDRYKDRHHREDKDRNKHREEHIQQDSRHREVKRERSSEEDNKRKRGHLLRDETSPKKLEIESSINSSHKDVLPIHNSDSKSSKVSQKPLRWLHQNLVVRVTDKQLKSGKYFKEKVVIEDVVKPHICNCRSSDGKLIEGLHEDQLETVIPRDVPATVMIVRGEHKFQLARVLHKDKHRCQLLLSLINEETQSFNLGFDDVCQFVEERQF